MKKFTKEELKAVLIIFLILIGISTPNFISSFMRGRDQNRKDDMGAIQTALASYAGDFGVFPQSSPDGKIVACKRPEDKVTVDKNGRLVVNLIPCEWGKDGIVDLTPGSTKVYIGVIPGDPDLEKGVSYVYNSNGSIYQIFAALESKKDPENDSKVILRKIMCGNKVCNLARHFGCKIEKTIDQCSQEAMMTK